MVLVTHGPATMSGGRRQRSTLSHGSSGSGGGGGGSSSSSGSGSPLVAARGKIIAKKRRSRARAVARLKKAGSRAQKAARALARAARRRKDAVRAWHREERRREQASVAAAKKPPSVQGKPSSPTDKSVGCERRVSFSNTLLVTNIPVDFEEQLPQPVQSPLHSAAQADDKAVVGDSHEDEETDEDDPDFDPRAIAFAQRWARLRPANHANVLDQDAASDTSDDSDSMEFSEDSDGDSDKSEDSDDSTDSISSSRDELRRSGMDPGKNPKDRLEGNDRSKGERGSNRDRAASGQDESVPKSSVKPVASECQPNGDDGNDHMCQPDAIAPLPKRPRPGLPKAKRSIDKLVKASADNSASSTAQGTPCKTLSNGLAAEHGRVTPVETAPGGSASQEPNIGEEIDSMFAGKCKKLKTLTEASPLSDTKLTIQRGGKTGGKHRSSPRYTEDGLRILTYDDIKAENTQELTGDCPFDCSCCY
jgi:hypothetical protein